MALFDSFKGQLRSVIEWTNPGAGELFQKWSENGDEIKNASKLIVNPGQGVVFVYQGKVEEVITQEGITQLKTDNVPFWTTVSKFMQNFESEHKVGIYFFRTTRFLDQKWGTSSTIKYDDPKYKFPVGLRAYGNYTCRITDPKGFFVNVVGASNDFQMSDLRDVMVDRIVQPLSDYLAEQKLSYAEIDAAREEIAEGISKKLYPDFQKLGFEMTDFRVEGTSFDEDTQRRIGRIADISAESQAAQAAGINYAQMQQLEAMKDAAKNEGGGAGLGMGLGAGMGMGNMMAGAMGGQFGQAGQPAPTAKEDVTTRLTKLKGLLDADLISKEDFEKKKADILGDV